MKNTSKPSWFPEFYIKSSAIEDSVFHQNQHPSRGIDGLIEQDYDVLMGT